MADSSVSKPILQADRGKLLWRFLFSFGLIASVVAVAAGIAQCVRPTP